MEKFGFTGKMPGVVDALQFEDMFIDGDDFTVLPIDDEDYAFTNDTTGDMTLSAAGDNGILLLDSVAGTSTQGANLQRPAANFVPKAGRTIFFETKVQTDLLGVEFFAGLAEINTNIISGSAVDTANHIGFTSITDNGLLLSNTEKAGVGTTGIGHQLEIATWVTLGIKVNGLTDITFYVDGDAVQIISTSANIPIVALSPSFVCQSDGTDATILSIDYWKCAQTR